MTKRLCHVDEIPELASKGFTVDKLALLVVKKNGNIFVYHNQCPHIGIALEWVADQFLDSSKTMIQCANHGALFLINNGLCVSGPCKGQSLVKHSFTVVDGFIEIDG